MTDTAPAPSRRRENTRTRLMDAAARMFAEEGIDASSVEAICERAGFTRGAFYSNFDSKEELFLALCGRSAEATLTAVRDRVASLEVSGLDADTEVRKIVQEVLEVAGHDRLDVLLGAEIRVQALRSADFAEAYLALDRGLSENVAQLVHDVARARGLSLRMPLAEATELLLTTWVAVSEHALITRRDPEGARRDLAERLSHLVALILE
ncbi:MULTISPECIES: TetR/AcrR family transcriptional regulator [Microbacterium]|jgi:AcrR family transcriptional regulator|uniref:TetR/AcrR family transcriptional regulator n=1 Tax=Microbacterium TaxID=33882 RepID=UPI001D17B814|nr:TetR/AcrR family transcriptional regulator [Microbacterium testaceum]MCC4250071.1 TetR/AcrR family transcriptional regulator [Microbacterium testaceum]